MTEYSAVVPIYNDGHLAPELCKELHRTMSQLCGHAELEEFFELIFVNDGSSDDSINTLKRLQHSYPFVSVIDLSRNFGQHQAIACGLGQARGRVIIRMNVDMQDHPSEIPKLLACIEETSCDLVVGQYETRNSPLSEKVTAWIYFRVFHFLTGFHIEQNTSPLRAMSRRFVDAYLKLPEKSRFPQGIDQWLGFEHKFVQIEHRKRADGGSSYNFLSRLKLALDGLLYFTHRPLQLIVTFGFALALIGFFLAMLVVVQKMTGFGFAVGYASFVSIGLLGFGLQISCLGVVGLYVSKIFVEVQNRPMYLVKDILVSKYEESKQEKKNG